jgi:hypothetical protein
VDVNAAVMAVLVEVLCLVAAYYEVNTFQVVYQGVADKKTGKRCVNVLWRSPGGHHCKTDIAGSNHAFSPKNI